MPQRGVPNHCPLCGCGIDPRLASGICGDLVCPNCRAELWFFRRSNFIDFYRDEDEVTRKIQHFIASQLGVDRDKLPHPLDERMLKELGADSLDTVELVMELEEEYDDWFDDDDDPPLAPA